MKVEGRIKVIGKTQEIGSKGFKKRELVVTVPDDKFPQHIPIQFIQDKVVLLDNLQVTQYVKVDVNLTGREWVSPQGEVKYFGSIQGWKIEVQPQSEIPKPPFETAEDLAQEQPDDLPF